MRYQRYGLGSLFGDGSVLLYAPQSLPLLLFVTEVAILMAESLVEKAEVELEQAQLQLDAALNAWDKNVTELWRTSIALTQAQAPDPRE
jgi:hypothetical protein